MFNVQSHTAAAVDTLRKAANGADKVNATLGQAMTVAFVALLAADPTASLKSVSLTITEKVPQSKESGNPAGTRKSQCNSFFKDDANRLAVYAAIPNPQDMDPEAFTVACVTYAKGVNPKAWLKDRADAAKKAAADQAEALKAAQRPMGDDETAVLDVVDDKFVVLNPGFDPVLANQTDAIKAITNLMGMPETDETLTALYAIFDLVSAALGVEVKEAIAA